MKTTHLCRAVLACLAVTGLTACHDAIFATIETERKAATNTLSQTLTVADIEPTSHAADSTLYTVAGGGIFQGTLSPLYEGTISWNPNSDSSKRPYNPSGLSCNSMALFGGYLYGGFIDSSGSGSLYKSSGASSSTPFSFGAGFGTSISIPSQSQVTLLRAAGGYLFRVLASSAGSPFLYELDYSSDGANWYTTWLAGLTSQLTGVGYDAVHAMFWAVAGSSLFKSSNVAFGSSTVVDPGINGDTINGLFVDSTNGRVFVLTKKNGVFFTTDDGANWQHVYDDSPSGGTGAAGFLSAGGPINPNLGRDIYLVGSDGFGYYSLNIDTLSFSRFDDTTITLYVASISDVLVDSSSVQQNILLGTNGQGVWRGVFDPSDGTLLSGTNQYWIHE